jgi:hypothetical protein
LLLDKVKVYIYICNHYTYDGCWTKWSEAAVG